VGGADEDGNCSDNFTDIQRDALDLVCQSFMHEHPEARVVGHSEVQRFKSNGHRKCPWIGDLTHFKTKRAGSQRSTLTELLNNATYGTLAHGRQAEGNNPRLAHAPG
jgi:N-acetyl-anhydromuramyl-L-alanine amidase AmpD